MNRWLKYIIIALIIAIGGTIFYNKVYIVKSTFATTKPTRGDLHVTVRGIGNVDAKNIYTITAQSGGEIENIYFDEGQWVKKGDLLLTIDPVDLPMLFDEEKVALSKAKHDVQTAQGDLESLKAQRALIVVTYKRYKELLQNKYVTQAEYDKALSDLQNIDAQINASRAKIASAKLEIERLQKSIEAIGAKLKRVKIYSPADGYVISKDAEVAQYVLPSTPIFKIVDPKTLWVVANIDERIADKIELGQIASIKLRSQPDIELLGNVQRIVAMSNLVTLEREVAIGFKTTPIPFYINEQAEVNIKVAKYENVLKVPLALIEIKDGEKGVWVANSDTAHFMPISILAQNNEEAAVSSGINKNTELLVPNAKNRPLRDGMKINR